MVQMTVARLLEKMVPDAAECRGAADELRRKHPTETAEELARRAVRGARQAGLAVGAATGAASNPIVMVPAALADMTAMLRIEGRMAGTIAALLDPAALLDGSLRADVVGILFPGAVSQVLRQVGVRAGEQATKNLIRKSLGEDAVKMAVKVATRHLGVDLTRNAIVEKTIPLVGAGIGAGWNWLEVGAVGNRAIHYYQGEPLRTHTEAAVHHARQTAQRAAKRIKAVVRTVTRGKADKDEPPRALPGPKVPGAEGPRRTVGPS